MKEATEIKSTFARRLHDLRRERGLTRAAVAERIGTTGPIYGRYERGERAPAVDTALRIAHALGVSLDYLVGDAPAHQRDRGLLYRLEVLERIPPQHRERILYTLDVLLKDAQAASLEQHVA